MARRQVVEDTAAERIAAEEWARVLRIDRIERNTGRRPRW